MSGPERFAAYLPFVLAVVYLAMAAAGWRAMRRWGALWALLVVLPAAAMCSGMGSSTADELVASWRAEHGGGVAGSFVATEVIAGDKTQTWIGTFNPDESTDIRDGVRLENPPTDMRPGTLVPARDTGAALVVYGHGPSGAFEDQLARAIIFALLLLGPGVWLVIALLRRGRAKPALRGDGDDDGLDWVEPGWGSDDDEGDDD